MSANESSNHNVTVTPLDAIKQRRRLDNLLYTRRRVAELATEHRSHRLDDATELWQLQLEVEQVINDEFPLIFEEHFAEWVIDDVVHEHHPQVLSPTCGLCHLVANTAGINIQHPYAA